MLGKKLLEEINSPINGHIQVSNFLGKPRIFINNMLQSGGLIESIWRKGIKRLQDYKITRVQRVLILGLGGGTLAQLINKTFPQADIVGVEIDPVMIKLGRKYFKLDKIKNLKIINKDAIKFINHYPLVINHFDLILVDLYLGNKFPIQAESLQFLKNLKKLTNKNGIIIFNRLFEKKDRKQVEEFIKKLDRYFDKIKLQRAFSNLLIFCQILEDSCI